MQLLAAAVVGVPMVGAVLCLAVRDKASKYVAIVAAVVTAVLSAGIAANMPNETRSFGSMPWLGKGAVDLFGYQIDPLACIMLVVSAVIGAAIVIYSAGYLSPKNRDHATESGQARYYFWLMVFVGAMSGLAISPTLLQLVIFWEMTTLCSWVLISFYDNKESLKAGMKALVMTSFGGLFMIGGLLWVFSATSSMKFDAFGMMGPSARAGAFALFLVAAWAKSAQVPFHTWLPEAMAAPTPISAYLHAASMVKAGVYLVARLLLSGWALPTVMGLVISIAALVTMFAALYLYFFQDDLKRLLAYSTIAQLGYVMLGLGIGALGADLAMRGAILHILMHACAKGTLFLAVGAIAYATGTRSISKLSGLASTMPLSALAFMLAAFALTGIPPLACFWSKLYVITGTLQLEGALGPVVLLLILLESLTAFGWFLWVAQKIFFGKPVFGSYAKRELEPSNNPTQVEICAPPASVRFVLVMMIVLTLVAPIFGIPLVQGLVIR